MVKWNRFKYTPVRPLGKDGQLVTGSPEHIRLSRTAAAEGMVLLKNEKHLLPLRKGSRVALFGKASEAYLVLLNRSHRPARTTSREAAAAAT